jgi:imidazolonepropionase-like amidohydrolase
MLRAALLRFSVLCLGWATTVSAVAQIDPPGFRPRPNGTHALVGARVFTKPDTLFSNATVVIRDGRIAAAGPDATVPKDARVWDCAGLTIYAGFIDPYLSLGTNRPVSTSSTQPISESADFTAAGGPRFFGVAGQERDPGAAGPGYGLADITPEFRVAAGYTPDAKTIESLRELGFTAANVVPTKGIIRGQSAVVTLGDTSPNEALLKPDASQCLAFAVSAGDDAYPNSLMGVIAAIRQTFFDAQHYAADQADYAARPAARSRPVYNAALDALRLARERQPVIVEPGSALMMDRAHRLAGELGITTRILVSSGQEWRRPDLAQAIGATFIVPLAFPALPKLPDEDSWEGISLDQLRTWDWAPENPALLRRLGRQVALTTYALGERKEFRKNLRTALDRGLSETDALAALTTAPAELLGLASQVGTIEPGKLANLTITDAKGYFDPEGKLRAVWVDGRPYEFAVPNAASAKASETPKTEEEKAAKEKADKKKAEARELARKRLAREPLAGRGVITNPPAIVIRNATIWTSGPQGILTNATLLLESGRVASVATGDSAIRIPQSAFVVDGSGLHVTPGILDAHSHSMVLGSVNEGTLPSTAMVRIGDVVNSETDNIHQQLAGGTTIANLLHGSANPIGGQSQVIKLRDGAGPEELKFSNAPPGIKFALGENVKQANWGEKYTTRFPQTRMGVPTFFNNRFTAAQQYRDALKVPSAEPVRRDLELEALAEILDGQRLIHCHSYRQDEILAFLRTMESFGVRVATLQHILEGYKVADEIAKHGAGASAFADWWGYKFEVIDAIPYAGSLMHARGVNVSFNSDSSDHARRLNFEAAKAVKYGGTPEAEALKFVTLNPAKQLGIDKWVGSLEPGKDADFVLWSGHPLDSGSVCLQTWIDGKKYFDRALEPARAKALADERAALIAKAKKLAGEGGDATASDKAREKFFQRALEHAVHLGVVNCQDCEMPRKD